MFEDTTLVYKAGKQVPFKPAIVTELPASGVLDAAKLIDLIRNRPFSAVITRDLRYRHSRAVIRAITENYHAAALLEENNQQEIEMLRRSALTAAPHWPRTTQDWHRVRSRPVLPNVISATESLIPIGVVILEAPS